MKIATALESDLPEILDLQKKAFLIEAERYNDYNISPLKQSLDEIKKEFNDFIFLKAEEENKIIGSVRANEKNKICYIFKVIVHPDHQDKGIGKMLMAAVEKEFSNCEKYQLFTGFKSQKNLAFYNKLGYSIFKIDKINDDFSMIYLEKHNN